MRGTAAASVQVESDGAGAEDISDRIESDDGEIYVHDAELHAELSTIFPENRSEHHFCCSLAFHRAAKVLPRTQVAEISGTRDDLSDSEDGFVFSRTQEWQRSFQLRNPLHVSSRARIRVYDLIWIFQ